MPIEGGARALYGRELAAAADPGALLEELERRLKASTSPQETAKSFGLADIIEPRETRRLLCRVVAASVAHRATGPKRGPAFRP
jgi:acetyl-CoA carboxylase carboxyltransferase component